MYATDFHNGTVDVFDKSFNLVHLDGTFTDPNAPPPAVGQPGFAPFGIQNINGTIFVTYALQKPDQHDDQAGTGNGFVDEFDTSGTFHQAVRFRHRRRRDGCRAQLAVGAGGCPSQLRAERSVQQCPAWLATSAIAM